MPPYVQWHSALSQDALESTARRTHWLAKPIVAWTLKALVQNEASAIKRKSYCFLMRSRDRIVVAPAQQQVCLQTRKIERAMQQGQFDSPLGFRSNGIRQRCDNTSASCRAHVVPQTSGTCTHLNREYAR